MRLYLVLKVNKEYGTEVIAISRPEQAQELVSKKQQLLKEQGKPAGISWQLHEGDFISAMVASARLGQ